METQQTSPAVAAFRDAFAGGDFSGAAAWLADDVVFRSPVLAKPWETKPVVERLGPAMVSILEDLRFTSVAERDGRGLLVFEARQGDVALEGVQLLDVGADGRITDMAIFIRPLRALSAVAAAMAQAVDPEVLELHGGGATA